MPRRNPNEPNPINPEQPCFMRVPVKAVPVVIAALQAAGMEQEARAVDEFTQCYRDPALNEERKRWIERAETRDGEIEIDSDSVISGSDDDGEYLMAWVWVPAPGHDCPKCGDFVSDKHSETVEDENRLCDDCRELEAEDAVKLAVENQYQ